MMPHIPPEWSLDAAESDGSDTPRSKTSARNKSTSPTLGDGPDASWLARTPHNLRKGSPVLSNLERARRGSGYAVNVSVGTMLRMLAELPDAQLQQMMTVHLNDANKVRVPDVLAMIGGLLADQEIGIPVYGIDQLPSELLEMTLAYLPPASILECERVCRLWRALCTKSVRIAAIWRRLCFRAWPNFAGQQDALQPSSASASASPSTASPSITPPPSSSSPPAPTPHVGWKVIYANKTRTEQAWLDPLEPVGRQRFLADTILTQDNGIHCVQFDATDLMTGSGERNEIGIWNMARAQEAPRQRLEGHNYAVTCLQFDESRVVSGSLDNTVRIWDRAEATCQRVLTGHRDKVWCVQFEGDRLVSGSSDKTVRVWDMNSGKSVCCLEEHRTSVSCVRMEGSTVVSSSAGNSIRVWNVGEHPTCIQKLRGHQKGVFCLQFDHSKILSGSLDATIRIWDPRDNYRNVCTIIATEGTDAALDATRPVGIICFAYDDTKIVSGGADGKVDVWDMRTWKRVTNFTAHTHWITSLQFDSNRLVTGSRDRSVKLWSVP